MEAIRALMMMLGCHGRVMGGWLYGMVLDGLLTSQIIGRMSPSMRTITSSWVSDEPGWDPPLFYTEAHACMHGQACMGGAFIKDLPAVQVMT